MDIFLSQLDPRQRPKGTRDSLGFEQTWTFYGRKIVVGITTITSSLDNFIVTLLGFYLSEENTDDDKDKAHFFMRYEQLIAYMRLEKDQKSNILGISRAKKNMQADGNKALSIHNQILSSQLSYGLWGLYSTALADVGLIKNRVLTPDGYKIIEIIKKEYPSLLRYIVSKSKFENSDALRYSEHVESVSELLANKKVRKILLSSLLKKSSLYKYIEEGGELLCDKTSKNLLDLTNNIINNKSIDEEFRAHISDIRKIDKVMLVANKLFNALSHANNDGESIDKYIESITKLKIPTLELPDGKIRNRDTLTNFVNSLNTKKHMQAIESLLEMNKIIMSDRNSIPWVEINEKNKLKIRVKTHSTIDENEKFSGMAYNYFICSYLSIAKHLKASL